MPGYGEHSFNAPDELRVLLIEAGFAHVEVQTVVQQIAFPSVLDYHCGVPPASRRCVDQPVDRRGLSPLY